MLADANAGGYLLPLENAPPVEGIATTFGLVDVGALSVGASGRSNSYDRVSVLGGSDFLEGALDWTPDIFVGTGGFAGSAFGDSVNAFVDGGSKIQLGSVSGFLVGSASLSFTGASLALHALDPYSSGTFRAVTTDPYTRLGGYFGGALEFTFSGGVIQTVRATGYYEPYVVCGNPNQPCPLAAGAPADFALPLPGGLPLPRWEELGYRLLGGTYTPGEARDVRLEFAQGVLATAGAGVFLAPEPGTLLLFGTGLAGVAAVVVRRRTATHREG